MKHDRGHYSSIHLAAWDQFSLMKDMHYIITIWHFVWHIFWHFLWHPCQHLLCHIAWHFIWHIVISNSAIFSLANDLTFCLTHIYYIIYIYCDICLDIIFNNNFQHLFWHILWNFIWHNTMLQFCLEYIVTCLAFCLQAREVQHMTPTLAKWSRFGHQGNDARLFIFQSGWRHDQGGAWVESCALIDAKNMQPRSAHSKLAKVRKCVCW